MEWSDDKNKRATRSVRWQRSCEMRLYGKPDQTDLSHAWFNEKDYKGFKKNCMVLSVLGKEIGAKAVEVFCKESCRGLEQLMCPTTSALWQKRREQAWIAVLEEQDCQWENGRGYCDITENAAMACRDISDGALEDARKRALADANEVASFSERSTSDVDDAVVATTEVSCDETDKQAVYSALKHIKSLLQGGIVTSSQSVPFVISKRNCSTQS